MSAEPKRRRQCAKCPWKKGTDPNKIPGGYSEEKHKALANTIAEPGDLRGLGGGSMRMMACHETTGGAEQACVGWVAHQLGEGNNLPLRLRAMFEPSLTDFDLVGPQHERFEDTLPKKRRGKR
jgi:hypothetical protein